VLNRYVVIILGMKDKLNVSVTVVSSSFWYCPYTAHSRNDKGLQNGKMSCKPLFIWWWKRDL